MDRNNSATKYSKKRWFTLEKIRKLKTCYFQIDESIFANAGAIGSNFSGLKSVISHGPQIFDRSLNGQTTTCFCYAVTFDSEHVNFRKDLRKAETVKLDNLTLHQCKLDNEGQPVLQSLTGLEFSFSAELLDERFLEVASSIKAEFKNFAKFYEVDKSLIFIDGNLAKLRIQVEEILMRPRGRYDLKLESGRRFSLIAKSFGVAPKGKQVPVSSQKKSCYKCGSDQHVASNCVEMEENKIDESKNISSTPAKSTTKRRSGRVTRKPDRYGIEKPRSNFDKPAFDDTSEIDLPKQSSELKSTRELLASTDESEKAGVTDVPPFEEANSGDFMSLLVCDFRRGYTDNMNDGEYQNIGFEVRLHESVDLPLTKFANLVKFSYRKYKFDLDETQHPKICTGSRFVVYEKFLEAMESGKTLRVLNEPTGYRVAILE